MNPNPDHHVVVRLSALGDAVLTTGVLRFWHERHGWTFTVVTREAFAPVFDRHPAVRGVEILRDQDLRGPALRTRWRELATAFAGQPLIDLHGTGRTRLLARYWQGPVRRYVKHGLARRLFLLSGGKLCRDRLLLHNVPQRYALALEAQAPPREALLPAIFLSDEEREHARTLANTARSGPDAPLIALHPYAAHRGKTWSVARWRELMDALDAANLAWCVVGRAEEAERFPDLPADCDFTNRCSLRESAALLAACTALITGDSGPMHLAGAVATPVIALFGCTTPEWGFYPYGPRDVILENSLPCRPCTLHGAERCARDYACLETLAPEAATQAMRALI